MCVWYVCICVYVCVWYVCICVYVCVCNVYVCVHVYVYACLYVGENSDIIQHI